MVDKILFEKYKVIALLGEGGYSKVWLVKHLKLNCLRAIKVINKGNYLHDRLIEEAYILRNLHHDSIPEIYDIEEDEYNSYIIEEYYKGVSLKSIRLIYKNLSEPLIINYIMQICDLIEYLHEGGRRILYLDLKPENLIVCDDRIVLVDFGAAVIADKIDELEFGMGTKGYAAPEQYTKRKPDIRSDVFGIGKILSFLISCDNKEGVSEINYSINKQLIRIMEKCLQNQPEKRYACVKDIKNDLLICHNEVVANSKNSILRRMCFKLSGIRRRKKRDNDLGISSKKIIIGVAATHTGAGATHLAIMIGNFFSKVLKKKTIILEKRTSSCLKSLSSYQDLHKLDKNDLGYGYIDKNKGINDVVTDEYEVCVVDFGVLDILDYNELAVCDKKFIATSLCEWKLDYLTGFISRYSNAKGHESWIYTTPFAADRKIKTVQKYYGITIKNIGFEPEYDNLGENTIKTLGNMLSI